MSNAVCAFRFMQSYAVRVEQFLLHMFQGEVELCFVGVYSSYSLAFKPLSVAGWSELLCCVLCVVSSIEATLLVLHRISEV